jgi:hypothetical protein
MQTHPIEVAECNCKLRCSYSVLWAYYPAIEVMVSPDRRRQKLLAGIAVTSTFIIAVIADVCPPDCHETMSAIDGESLRDIYRLRCQQPPGFVILMLP